MPERTSPERPADDETRTWHEHDDDTWAWGPLCLECMVDMPQAGDMPYFNIKRLKTENATGFGVDSFKREIYENARRDGRDITLQK